MTLRSEERELIDDVVVDGEPLRRMLEELGRINQLLGGTSASLTALSGKLPRKRGYRFLDVGTGGADVPLALLARSNGEGGARIVGLDLSHRTCALARERSRGGLRVVAGDGFHLPFADRSFDVVHCALVLHHMRDAEIPRFLAELRRVARLGVLVNDLHRHALAEHSIRVLTGIFARSRFIKHDAPISVRRAFTRPELKELASATGVENPEIRWRWAFRYTMWIPGTGGASGDSL